MGAATARYEDALRLSHEWHTASDLAEFPTLVLTGLGQLVEADAVGWNDFDPIDGRLRVEVVPDEGLHEDVGVLERWAHQHPLLDRLATDPFSAPVSISDFCSRRAFHRLDLYQEFFRPHEIEYQVGFGVATDGFVGIALNRRTSDFSPDERQLLDLVRPHVAAAYPAARARAEAHRRLEQLERGLRDLGQELVVLDRHGGVEYASPDALALLRRHFGSAGHSLPPELAAVGDSPVVLHGSAGSLTVRRVRGELDLLLLDETRARPLDRALAATYRLTRREIEIFELVGLGYTTEQTASALVLSPRTVDKHVEHALDKLGVHARRDAVELLFPPS
jgi:DNA-binding CsgD family transcriptional regulator